MSPLKTLLSVCAFSVVMFSSSSMAEIFPPDPKFFLGNTALVHFGDPGQNMDQTCQDVGVSRTEDYRLTACAGVRRRQWNIWVRNPCNIDEPYAKELCHELSHVNGFRHPEYQ